MVGHEIGDALDCAVSNDTILFPDNKWTMVTTTVALLTSIKKTHIIRCE